MSILWNDFSIVSIAWLGPTPVIRDPQEQSLLYKGSDVRRTDILPVPGIPEP
jgi:hypothetical protein